MSGQAKERTLIEQILRMLCPAQGTARPSGEAEAAMLRLPDEMPGEFLICCADRGEEITRANQALPPAVSAIEKLAGKNRPV